jgi:hypothetical protein
LQRLLAEKDRAKYLNEKTQDGRGGKRPSSVEKLQEFARVL